MSTRSVVTPAEFIFVLFAHDEVLDLVERVRDAVAFPAELPLVVAVNESTPLQRVTVSSMDPVTVEVESGAFEDPRRPRRLSAEIAEAALAKVLFRVKDRLDGSFAEAPADDKLTHAQRSAWNVYAVGRSGRAGFAVQQQRQRYGFRNRHAFSDAADAVFDQLWTADAMTWSTLQELSASVTTVRS